MGRTELIIHGLTGVGYAAATVVMLLAYWQSGEIEPPVRRLEAAPRDGRTFRFAGRFLRRVALTGVVLFLLPPFAGDPPLWQIGLALLVWVALAYRYGLWGRGCWFRAAAESLPAVGLSLIWTHLLVLAGGFAAAI